jgi:hypothetical protein
MNTAITCGISDDLIARIADYVQEQYVAKGQDLSRLAFVFGGKRPSLFLKKELARHIRGSFVSPRFFSMDEFMNEVVARREFVAPLSGIDACYSLYTITRDTAPDIMAGRETFSQFMPWASELAAFIDHVDSENIADAALENVQANAAIGYDVPDTINTLLRHIRRIREAFHGKMTEQKKYTRGRTYRSAAEHIADVPFDDFDQIVFCNLFYLTATERTVIKTLYDRGKATLFFQGDQKDWPVLDTLARNFSCRIQPPHHAEPNYELHLYAGFDTHSQVTIAREIVKKIDRWDKTVLVVPEPTAIIPVLSEIAPLVQALNVSLGYPLKRSSLYALFESIFKAQSTRRDGTYYTKDYLHAISHPLVKNLRLPFDLAVTRVLVHKIEEILLGIEESPLGGSLFVALKDLQDAQPLYRSTLETLQRMGIRRAHRAVGREPVAQYLQFHRPDPAYGDREEEFHTPR